jgi:hypothetical protein
MSKATHTTGPWHRNIRADGKYPVIFAGRNTHVAAAKGHGDLPPEEIEANIDLIASAPELLEALEAVVDRYAPTPTSDGPTNPVESMWLNARAAIAKARGDV